MSAAIMHLTESDGHTACCGAGEVLTPGGSGQVQLCPECHRMFIRGLDAAARAEVRRAKLNATRARSAIFAAVQECWPDGSPSWTEQTTQHILGKLREGGMVR